MATTCAAGSRSSIAPPRKSPRLWQAEGIEFVPVGREDLRRLEPNVGQSAAEV